MPTDPTKAALAARRVRPVPLPSGGTAFVRTLTLAELRAVNRELEAAADADKLAPLALSAIAFASTEAGGPIFTHADRAEVEALPLEVLTALTEAGDDLNGFTRKAVDAGKAGSPATPC
jgi:hypothetical protein